VTFTTAVGSGGPWRGRQDVGPRRSAQRPGPPAIRSVLGAPRSAPFPPASWPARASSRDRNDRPVRRPAPGRPWTGADPSHRGQNVRLGRHHRVRAGHHQLAGSGLAQGTVTARRYLDIGLGADSHREDDRIGPVPGKGQPPGRSQGPRPNRERASRCSRASGRRTAAFRCPRRGTSRNNAAAGPLVAPNAASFMDDCPARHAPWRSAEAPIRARGRRAVWSPGTSRHGPRRHDPPPPRQPRHGSG
jgi:hypothetical protein